MSFISNIFFTDDATYLSENEVEVSKRILSFLSIMKDVLVSRPSRNVANQTLDKLDQVWFFFEFIWILLKIKIKRVFIVAVVVRLW